MLQADPQKRISAKEAMRHPYFADLQVRDGKAEAKRKASKRRIELVCTYLSSTLLLVSLSFFTGCSSIDIIVSRHFTILCHFTCRTAFSVFSPSFANRFIIHSTLPYRPNVSNHPPTSRCTPYHAVLSHQSYYTLFASLLAIILILIAHASA